MQYKNLDIKTVDLFFEIFADPKKFTERMADMRKVRDAIAEDLGTVDTKAKADKLFREASAKMAAATAKESKVRAESEELSAKFTDQVDRHYAAVDKGQKERSKSEEALASEKSDFFRASSALKKDLDDRLEDVAKREGAVSDAEASLAVSMKSHADYVKRVKEAV